MLFRILQKPLIYDNDDNESYDSTELVKCGSFSLQIIFQRTWYFRFKYAFLFYFLIILRCKFYVV